MKSRVNNHNISTEVLIVTSQVVFFVLPFLILKNALIDRRNLLADYNSMVDNAPIIAALYFAIFMFVSLLMFLTESYAYAFYVVTIALVLMVGIAGYDVFNAWNVRSDRDVPAVVEEKGVSKIMSKPRSNTATSNPFKF